MISTRHSTLLLAAQLALAQLSSQPHTTEPDDRRPSNVVLAPSGNRVAYVLGDSLMVATRSNGRTTRHAVARNVSAEATTPVPFIAWSPDSRQLLYRARVGNNAQVPMLVDADASSVPRQLVADSVASTLWTLQVFLAGGPTWSPDGQHVAFLGVRGRDPRVGPHLFVVDVATGEIERWGTNERRIFSIAWSPDGRQLAYTTGVTARGDSTRATIEVVDARPGVSRTPTLLLTDTTSLLRSLSWSPDGRAMIAQDRARRTTALALSGDIGSATHPRITATVLPHSLPDRAYAGWIDGSSALLSSVSSEMSARIVKVAFPSGATTLLTGPDTLGRAIGTARLNQGGTAVAFILESGSVPSDVWLAQLERNGALTQRANVTETGTWLSDRDRPRTNIVRWASAAGDTLSAQLLLPPRSTGGMPPLIVVPYGGYSNTFPRADYFLDRGILALIRDGYAVVRPNTRGTDSDRRDIGRYGEMQLEDTHLLLDAIAARKLADVRRVAVIGHSHGGAMAYFYATHSARFCAAVAINGRADWVLQANHPSGDDGLLPSILGGTPGERPELYARLSPAANARAVVAPLLAVAGGKDGQILPQNVPIMADSMRAAGKEMEALVFQDEGHVLQNPSNIARLWGRAFATLRKGCGT